MGGVGTNLCADEEGSRQAACRTAAGARLVAEARCDVGVEHMVARGHRPDPARLDRTRASDADPVRHTGGHNAPDVRSLPERSDYGTCAWRAGKAAARTVRFRRDARPAPP